MKRLRLFSCSLLTTLLLALQATVLPLMGHATTPSEVEISEISAKTWVAAKQRGESDLMAARAANSAVLKTLAEPSFAEYEKKWASKSKKIALAWFSAKQRKLSDIAAAKASGFTKSKAKPGDIFILKQGIDAWTAAKSQKKSDALASKAFVRAIWDAGIDLQAIVITTEKSVVDVKASAEAWQLAQE